MATKVLALAHSFETTNSYKTAELATNSGNIVNTLAHPLTDHGQDYYLELPHNATRLKEAYSRYAGDVGDSLDGVVTLIYSSYVRFEELNMDAAGAVINLLQLQTAADVLCSLQLNRVDATNHTLNLLDSDGTSQDSDANTFTEGVWHWLELYVARSTVAGVAIVYVDGSQVLISAGEDFGDTAGDVRIWWRGQTGSITGTATDPLWANACLFGDGGGASLSPDDFQSASGKTTFCLVEKPNKAGATPDFEESGDHTSPVDLDDGQAAASWSSTVGDNNTATWAIYHNAHGGSIAGGEPYLFFYGGEIPIAALLSMRYSTIHGAAWAWNFRKLFADGAGYAAAADTHVLWGKYNGLGAGASTTETSAGVQSGDFGRVVPQSHARCPDRDAPYCVIGFANDTAPGTTKIVRCRDHWFVYVVDTPLTWMRQISVDGGVFNSKNVANDRYIISG